jgi:rhodanese-related sulfurtransferase
MTYTEEQLALADDQIPRVKLNKYYNDKNDKVMIDVRQLEELEASGTIKDSLHIPKGVIEFRVNSSVDINFETSIYVFCAIGIRSALAGHNLKKIGYKNVFNLVGFQDILEQGAEIHLLNN